MLLFATAVAAGCAHGGTAATPPPPDAPADAARRATDAASLDAQVTAPDAPVDAGCAINPGVTPMIDGVNDLADYPAGQQLTVGAPLAGDAAAIAWDRAHLFVTVTSTAFMSAYEPLHVYVEAGTALGAATPSQGKEYSTLVPQLPFSPNYLVAARRVTDSGTGPYDGVYTPAGGWTTRATAFVPGTDVFVSSDQLTLSIVVPWTALGGCPTSLRLAVHVVHAITGNEWKDLIPTTHTPWQAPGGGYYEIDLTNEPAVTGWALH